MLSQEVTERLRHTPRARIGGTEAQWTHHGRWMWEKLSCWSKGKNHHNTMEQNFPNLKRSSKLYIIIWTASRHNTPSQYPIWNFKSHAIFPFILCVPRSLLMTFSGRLLLYLKQIKTLKSIIFFFNFLHFCKEKLAVHWLRNTQDMAEIQA